MADTSLADVSLADAALLWLTPHPCLLDVFSIGVLNLFSYYLDLNPEMLVQTMPSSSAKTSLPFYSKTTLVNILLWGDHSNL